jgi:CRISPR/Cas system endoribonuclease Cas6 (RAMP superfamily)
MCGYILDALQQSNGQFALEHCSVRTYQQVFIPNKLFILLSPVVLYYLAFENQPYQIRQIFQYSQRAHSS